MRLLNRHGIPILKRAKKKPYPFDAGPPKPVKLRQQQKPQVLSPGKMRGNSREERFYKAFQEQGFAAPEFFISVRKATEAEDALGSDFFMLTTEGKIPFNVKSSKTTLKKHKHKANKQRTWWYKQIIGFIVEQNEAAESIRERAFEEAIQWRLKFLLQKRLPK